MIWYEVDADEKYCVLCVDIRHTHTSTNAQLMWSCSYIFAFWACLAAVSNGKPTHIQSTASILRFTFWNPKNTYRLLLVYNCFYENLFEKKKTKSMPWTKCNLNFIVCSSIISFCIYNADKITCIPFCIG